MKELEKTFQELLVDLNSDARFNSPKNFKKIEKNAQQFAKLVHELKSNESPDQDPTIKLIASRFASEADHAALTLTTGHRAYARGVLKSLTNYCMACHTRSNMGPQFQSVTQGTLIRSLGGIEKADFFASVRQFDQALEEYGRILNDEKNIDQNPFNWEKAVRMSLAISVRVKKDPNRALAVVDRILAQPKAPYFLKEQAIQWKASLNSWKSETPTVPQTDLGYRAEAIRLLSEAKQLQKYPADRSADILYLRASSAIHDLMSVAPKGPYIAEALFLAGLSYEVLSDLNLWDMHEYYYLACIETAPHSEQAKTCYRHYEQSIYFGYTGSSGTRLPPNIKKKLKELEELANPKASVPQ